MPTPFELFLLLESQIFSTLKAHSLINHIPTYNHSGYPLSPLNFFPKKDVHSPKKEVTSRKRDMVNPKMDF